ncbi:MAG: hypothetical protein HN610_09035 [Verrucomicrobia bacterium]|nr:hypothetical protein [Verrucomicrobiota bacterium]
MIVVNCFLESCSAGNLGSLSPTRHAAASGAMAGKLALPVFWAEHNTEEGRRSAEKKKKKTHSKKKFPAAEKAAKYLLFNFLYQNIMSLFLFSMIDQTGNHH